MQASPASSRVITAPRGPKLSCRTWQAEAALRMLMNNLDPEVAERPQDLVVYGGTGKAARSWPDYHRIVASLRSLEADETLLVQSGRAVGIFKTHEDAPRVLLANGLLVPKWATWDEHNRLDALGLTMFGQMTAGSWIYIGTQGILQGTYETFGSLARQQGWESLKGKFVLTAGLGEMGGAQPLAITMNQGVGLIIEIDRWRAERRLNLRQIDAISDTLEEAMTWVQEALDKGKVLFNWDERKAPGKDVKSVAGRAMGAFAQIREAMVFAFVPPAVLDAGLAGSRQVVMLEPRRIAARWADRRGGTCQKPHPILRPTS